MVFKTYRSNSEEVVKLVSKENHSSNMTPKKILPQNVEVIGCLPCFFSDLKLLLFSVYGLDPPEN